MANIDIFGNPQPLLYWGFFLYRQARVVELVVFNQVSFCSMDGYRVVFCNSDTHLVINISKAANEHSKVREAGIVFRNKCDG